MWGDLGNTRDEKPTRIRNKKEMCLDRDVIGMTPLMQNLAETDIFSAALGYGEFDCLEKDVTSRSEWATAY